MKDQALALAAEKEDPTERLNVLREYVQACILRSLHESEAANGMALVDGTALRFLENLPRFSEDLDFSMTDADCYTPVPWLEKMKRELSLAGFDCALSWNDRKVVQTAWIRIAGLLYEAGISTQTNQKLAIKLEIDTRPPEGAELHRTVITRHLTFVISHYSLPCLMAGKVHALLTRSYPKGRDWYDLLWYRSHRPPMAPKLDMLQSALDQTLGVGSCDSANWQALLHDKLDSLDMDDLIADVAPFLERQADRHLLSRDNLRTLVASR